MFVLVTAIRIKCDMYINLGLALWKLALENVVEKVETQNVSSDVLCGVMISVFIPIILNS